MRILKPTLLINKTKCKSNIRRMAEKAAINKLQFRPHFKTHQSAEVGEWFREEGVSKITVSSVTMAEYFAAFGWKDILIAFPVNILEIDKINALSKNVKLSLLVESVFTVNYLKDKLTGKTDIYIKIDTGYHRTGILPGDTYKIKQIIDMIQESTSLRFTGFLTHAGNTYDAKNRDEILKLHFDSVTQLNTLKKEFTNIYPGLIISVGDTPSCSVANDFDGIDEIRPGNFVFYDVMQYYLGSCTFNEIAACLACPVVAKHENRNEIVIYGGAVHLSQESLTDKTGKELYGLVVKLDKTGWSKILTETYVSGLSQEHGIIKTNKGVFENIQVGDLIGILPVHSCLTANLMKYSYFL
ncbi:MAG: alanine racemase [Bacteroidetes bacterium 4484_249]|nr:MAG: alanine racemase [Bacteroidetes bacterium 4484_249]